MGVTLQTDYMGTVKSAPFVAVPCASPVNLGASAATSLATLGVPSGITTVILYNGTPGVVFIRTDGYATASATSWNTQVAAGGAIELALTNLASVQLFSTAGGAIGLQAVQ